MDAMCAFFEADPEAPATGGVSSDGHDAEPGLHFFVPVAGTPHAVRVPVCRRHRDELAAAYGSEEDERADVD